jgi:hypothetical protein
MKDFIENFIYWLLAMLVPPGLLFLFMAFASWSFPITGDLFDIWRGITVIWWILVNVFTLSMWID